MDEDGALIDRLVEHAIATARTRSATLVGMRLRGGQREEIAARAASACARMGHEDVEVSVEEGAGAPQLCAVELIRAR